jgi:hypothetical protein
MASTMMLLPTTSCCCQLPSAVSVNPSPVVTTFVLRAANGQHQTTRAMATEGADCLLQNQRLERQIYKISVFGAVRFTKLAE